MAGWNLQEGDLKNINPSEQELWNALNHFFRNSRKTTTYKFCFLKCLVDYVITNEECEVSFPTLFKRFAEIYWVLIVKYGLCQVNTGLSTKKSVVETIIEKAAFNNNISENMKIDDLPKEVQLRLLKEIYQQCSKSVVGAFYESTQGLFYVFSKTSKMITMSPTSHDFLRRYSKVIEETNYFNWAKMIEQINGDNTPKSLVTKMSLIENETNGVSVPVIINNKKTTETEADTVSDLLSLFFRFEENEE